MRKFLLLTVCVIYCLLVGSVIVPLQLYAESNPDNSPRAVMKDFKTDFELARDYINNGQYPEAISILLRLIKDDQDNYNLNFLLGYSYYYIEAERGKAIPFLEKAVMNTVPDYNDNSAKERNAPVFAYYYLGLCYHWAGKLEPALSNMETFRGFLVSKTGKLINQKNFEVFNDVNFKIDQVKKALTLMKSPLRVEFIRIPFVNAGNYSGYGAQLTQDAMAVYFTRERINDKIRGRSDMYLLKRAGSNWIKVEQVGQNMNSPYNDMFNSISLDAKFLLFSSDRKGVFNIFYSMQDNNRWTEPYDNLSINSNFNETYAIVSNDGSRMIFVSDRPGGFGGKDIYKIEKKADGSWSQPENLGFTLNTPMDEDTPWLSEDGNTLYFSSKGHAGMGGYDVFRSEFRNNMWLEPVNIGYPVNSVGDDIYFKYVQKNNLILLATNRKKGGNNFEILGARHIDSTRTSEVFSPESIPDIPDSLAWDAGADPKPENLNLSHGKTTQNVDTASGKPFTEQDIVRQQQVADSIARAEQNAEEERRRILAQAAEEKERKLTLEKEKLLADSLREVQKLAVENQQNIKSKAAEEKARKDKLAMEQRVTDSLQAVQKISTETQQADLAKATESKAKQDSINKVRQKQVSDSLTAVRIAQVKADLQKKRSEEIATAARRRQDSIAASKKAAEAEQKRLADVKINEEKVQQEKLAKAQRTTDSLLRAQKTAEENKQALLAKTAEEKTTEEKPQQVKLVDTQRVIDSLKEIKRISEAALQKELALQEKRKQEIKDKSTATTQNPTISKPKSGEALSPCSSYEGTESGQYTVQVGAGWMKIKYFSSIEDKHICYGPDGIARFVVGTFAMLEDAEKLAGQLRFLGFTDAWIPEIDEKRCICPDNALLVQAGVLDKGILQQRDGLGPRYTVQLGAGNMKIKYFRKLQQVRACQGKDGLTRFTFGEFYSLEDATKVRDWMVGQGFLDAWTPPMDENRCGSIIRK